MGDVHTPTEAGRPVTNRPVPTIMRHGRRGDGLMATFHLADPNRFAAMAQSKTQLVQRAHLLQLIQAIDPAIFDPVRSAVAAERQAMDTRAQADRQERRVLLVQAELKRVQGDLTMPGVEKLNRERQLGEQLNREQAQVTQLVQAAQTLEARAANYRAAGDRLYDQIANEANQRAARELVAQAKARIDRWASLLPAEFLFVEEYCGMAGVGYLNGELKKLKPGEDFSGRQPQGHLSAPVSAPRPPAGSFAEPVNQQNADPMLRFPRVEGLDGRGYRVVYQDFPLGNEALVARSIRELTRPGWRVSASLVGANQDLFRVTATQIGPDVYQGQPADWNGGSPQGPAADFHAAVREVIGPTTQDQVRRQNEPPRPGQIEYPPFHPEWPPPDEDNGVPDLGPQPGTFSDGEGNDPNAPSPISPYTVAQEAIRRAQEAIQRGQVPQAPVSAAATDAANTTEFDQTNGGWNGAATPEQAVNGTPFAASDVDAALGNLFGGGLGGPAVELGPDEMPI